jgi:hypothetical protein
MKTRLKKTEEHESCRKTLALQVQFCSFLVHISPKEATELARKDPKLKASTVLVPTRNEL